MYNAQANHELIATTTAPDTAAESTQVPAIVELPRDTTGQPITVERMAQIIVGYAERRDLAPISVAHLKRKLDKFAEWAGRPGDSPGALVWLLTKPYPLQVDALYAYRTHLEASGLNPNTISYYLAGPNAVLGNMAHRGIIEKSPRVAIRRVPREPEESRNYGVSIDDAIRACEAVRTKKFRYQAEYHRERDACMMRLIIDMAWRRDSVRMIRLQDVFVGEADKPYRIRIRSKGKRAMEEKFIPEATALMVREYMKIRGKDGGPTSFLFAPKWYWNKPIASRQMNRTFLRISQEVGVRITPHRIRRAAITLGLTLCENDYRAAQAYAGHKRLSTTFFYDNDGQKRALKIAERVANYDPDNPIEPEYESTIRTPDEWR